MGGLHDERVDGLLLGGILPVAGAGEGRAGRQTADRPHGTWGEKVLDGLATLDDRLLEWYGLAALLLLWELTPRFGWLVIQAQESYHVTRIFAGAAVITGLALAVDGVLKLIGGWLAPVRETEEDTEGPPSVPPTL